MAGYFDDPGATAAAIRDGWFHSGDAAVVHPDGYIEIRDRFKDVIISGGENISSVEVEGVLLRHAAILEAAVVGQPDEQWGESPHAYIVLKPGLTVTDAELREFARDQPRPLQGAARLPLHRRPPQDRNRKNSEVRAPSGQLRDFPAVVAACSSQMRCPGYDRPSLDAPKEGAPHVHAGQTGIQGSSLTTATR